MPRNAAKKTNKNAKRLPVLIKLVNINNNKKTNKNNSNRNINCSNNNNNNKNNTIKNNKKKKKQNINSKKEVKSTFTNKLNKIDDSFDNNITTTNNSLKEILLNSPHKQTHQQQQQQKGILEYFKNTIENNNNFENKKEDDDDDDTNFIFNNNNNHNKIVDNNCIGDISSFNNNKTKATSSSALLTSTSNLSPISSNSSSPTSCTSSLYPIVVETTVTFEQENALNKTSSLLTTTSTIATTTHSNNNHTHFNSIDTTLKSQQKSPNKVVATTFAKRNNNNKQSKTLQATTQQHQSQEVKARLATLRTRKVLESSPDKAQKVHKSTTTVTTLDKAKEKQQESSEENLKVIDKSTSSTEISFIRKVFSVPLDEATLNCIETLNDNEIKKPTNKRKRNQTAVLLGLNTLHQSRSKRTNATTSVGGADKFPQLPIVTTTTTATTVAVIDKKEQKLSGNFLKPLPVEATQINTKKRPRIMSLYERPYQTAANEGGRSVVGNGYMTSSRANSTAGVVAGGGSVVIMNDTTDTQEMANQYYLSGNSGSGIAVNSIQPLVGNGSAINHAPTMGTLCNIGNTCYLNSVVYTLRFAPQFLHNLHHLLADLNALQQNIARARAKSSSLGRGISAVHMENARSWSSKDLASMDQYNTTAATTSGPLAIGPATGTIAAAVTSTTSTALTQVTQKSSHQLLTEKLHDLYESLHRNEINESTEPHHADTLLHAIQDVSSIFEGNQQQDAHEFLMCLLNSIRETSQTLIKAIAECPDVIMNGYISNPDEMERDLIKNTSIGGGGIGSSNNSNSLASSALSSLTSSSKTSSFFSRKSKRKDETKNAKNSRLQSPLKDALMASVGNNGQAATTTTANSLFYLNTNDLNSATSSSPSSVASSTVGGGVSMTSPSNSLAHLSGSDESEAPSSAVALLLKDKQRLQGKIRELGLDFFNEDFEGITVSSTKCLSCETITEQKETMIDIAVPVPQAGYDSNEFMDRPSSFIQNSCITREYFRNENKYRCEQCCGYTEAIRSISYEILPRLLIIQLSRFSGGMEKINSYIPTSFTLQCFCSKCCELSDANKLHIYKLYSVITHVGATMSVGHYIAYTCSLDWANEYINCPKEQRRRASHERQAGAAANGTLAGGSVPAGTTQSSNSGLGSSSTSFMKMKMKFGRSKASSSGDMSKNVKHLNGLTTNSKTITNGIGKLTMNSSSANAGVGVAGTSMSPSQCPVTCQSINCCAMRLTAQQQLQYQSANNSTSDFSEESSQYSNGSGYNTNPVNFNNNIHHPYTTTPASTNTSGYGSTGRGSTKASYATTQNKCSEPIWYMCDDDKIKAMTQREFEELLSPARKITITPYLLFYARYNLQSTPPKSATGSSSSPGPTTSSPQTSWSNESLQSSGHSAHSSGMRM